MTQKLTILSALFLAALLSELKHARAQVPAPTPTPEYTIIDLGTLGGDYSDAYGINDRGQVVGNSTTSNASEHAFLYSNSTMQDLGTFGGNSYARGINDSGQVIGYSQVRKALFTGDYPNNHAFLYSNGSMKDLGTLGGKNSYAWQINNSGQVVGASKTSPVGLFGTSYFHAFLYSNGSMKDLGTLGGKNSYAWQINNSGQVVGDSETSPVVLFGASYFHAFLYSNGSMKDLGTLGGENSYAHGINNSGQVVGNSELLNFYIHAFLYSNGSMRDLNAQESRGSKAYGINDAGQVVGYHIYWGGNLAGYMRAFLYSNGVRRDLDDLIHSTSGWRLVVARAINNVGHIVGYGQNPSGKTHAFLLNPLPLGWRKTIEKQPLQPTYSEPPKKENAKDSLVVVTHGWQPAWKPVDIAWVDEMIDAIRVQLAQQGLQNWEVAGHKWVEKARPPAAFLTGGAKIALINGKSEGVILGGYIAEKGFGYVHLIAHSAGSALIQAAGEVIKSISPNTTVHLTFLDPFVGFDEAGRANYGKGADWADSYYSRDIETLGGIYPFTEGTLTHSYNVNVTFLDKRKRVVDTYRSPSGAIERCEETASSHRWPIEFYLKTILEVWSEASGLGFALSKAGGNWEGVKERYAVGNAVPHILGTPDSSCPVSFYATTPAVLGPVLDFSTPLERSETGLIKTFEKGFRMETSSPVWFAFGPTVTNRMNFIRFEAAFGGEGREGLLTVYWNTEVLGSLDERATPMGVQQYTFPLPTVETGGQVLGFRLDSFSDMPSSVIVSNVSLGYRGLAEPFSLRFVGFGENGTPILEMNGPSKFTYAAEASADLSNWEVVALVENSIGTTQFTGGKFSGSAVRFYRAVAP